MSQAEADSTTLPTPIPTPLNVTALAKRFGVARTTIQRRLKEAGCLQRRASRAQLIWSPVTLRPVQARLKLGVARPPYQVRSSRELRPIQQHYRVSAAIYP